MQQFYYKNNRLQQLKGFYYTVQTGSISSCAKKLGLTQSAVSMQIKSLERDLEIKLFVRDGKKLRLTPEGKEFYTHSLHYVQGLEDLFETAANYIKSKRSNVVTIGANHASICYILPKYIKKFKEKYINIKLKIINIDKENGIKKLLENEIDFLISPTNQFDTPRELDFFNIADYHPIVLVNKENPISKRKYIDFEDLKNQEIVRIEPKLITLPFFEKLLKDHNLKSSIEFESADWEILKKFVKANIGVAIISNIVLEDEAIDSNITSIKINNYSSLIMSYGILLKKGKILNDKQKYFLNMFTDEK